MHFDIADLPQLEANNQLEDVVLHEMGHVLGIGSLWSPFGLLSGAGTSDPFFIGASGREGFSLVGGNLYLGNPVPVENTGGPGTADGHWRESVLNTELMTGYASPPGVHMPLSLVTIGSLDDLGYAISIWGFDVYRLGVDLRRGAATQGRQLGELPPRKPPVAIDDAGRIVPQVQVIARARSGASGIDRARLAPRQLESVKRQ
jgi:hypothetical protein